MLLLVGPPGMGKSALGRRDRPRDGHRLPRGLGTKSIKNAADLNTLLLSAKDKDVVHIDECHELAKNIKRLSTLPLISGS